MAKTTTLLELAKSTPMKNCGQRPWHEALPPAFQAEFFEFIKWWVDAVGRGEKHITKKQAMELIEQRLGRSITVHTFDKYCNAK